MNTKYIFIDFAETLGYRIKSEYEGDLHIVHTITGISLDKIRETSLEIKKEVDIYDRTPHWYENLERELDQYVIYFELILKRLGCNIKLARNIVEKKLMDIRHALYTDVKDFFEQLKNDYKFIVVSDGLPSRRVTVKNLGLDGYLTNMYTSDELGMFKSTPLFFQKVFLELGITDSENVFLIDDSEEAIKSAKTEGINTFLIDRKGKTHGAFVSLSLIGKMLK